MEQAEPLAAVGRRCWKTAPAVEEHQASDEARLIIGALYA